MLGSLRLSNLIIISVAISIGFVALSTSLKAGVLEITGAKKVGERVSAFDELTSIKSGDGISLSVTAAEPGELRTGYRFSEVVPEIRTGR